VSAGEGERGLVVIENCALPVHGGVTEGAVAGEPRCAMVRIGGLVEVRHVARSAIGRHTGEIPADVALRAGQRHVRAGERERRLAMVERGAFPLLRGVANGTILRETRCHVIWIRGFPEIREMASSARCRSSLENVVGVALDAFDGLVRASERKRGFVVIEARALPLSRGVAGIARGGESGSRMIWIRGCVELLEMAGGAVLGRACELVVDVTLSALHGGVRAGQSEGRLAVIEGRAFPLRGGMADIALGGEARRRVIGIRSFVEILQVTARAVLRHSPELAARVARCARHGGMRAGEFELADVVIELGVLPVRGRMTGVALGGDVALRVRRVCGLLEVRQVATRAINGRALESVVHMAGGTLHGLMRAGERERSAVVIERRSLPTDIRVTGGAIVRESRGGMRRVLRGAVICHVATEAIGGSACEAPAHMTGDARETRVSAKQRKFGESRVVELCALPLVHGVARVALERQLGGGVVGVLRLLIVVQVAAHALGTQTDEHSRGCIAVAGIAGHSGVRSK